MAQLLHDSLEVALNAERQRRRMTVRPAKRGDLPAVMDIYNHAVAQADLNFEIDPWDTPATERWFASITAPDPVLVAMFGSTVVGFACYTDFRRKGGYCVSKECSVYVDPDCQHCGVASALYRDLLSIAQRQGLTNLVAVVAGSNVASQRLHHTFGFEKVGVLPKIGRKLGVFLDAQLWLLPLEPWPAQPA